jgi:hypothetical protein
MTRRPARVTQAKIKCAVKAALDAGVEIARVEVDKDDKIIVIAARPGEHTDVADDLDKWLAKRHAH